jgi:hypothetical protein
MKMYEISLVDGSYLSNDVCFSNYGSRIDSFDSAFYTVKSTSFVHAYSLGCRTTLLLVSFLSKQPVFCVSALDETWNFECQRIETKTTILASTYLSPSE